MMMKRSSTDSLEMNERDISITESHAGLHAQLRI